MSGLGECQLKHIKKYEPILDLFADGGNNFKSMRDYNIQVIATAEYNANNDIELILFDKALQKYENHTLFIEWPIYNDDLPSLALLLYTGKIFLYFGSLRDGSNLKSEFFDILDKHWNIIHKELVSKNLNKDIYFIIYERK